MTKSSSSSNNSSSSNSDEVSSSSAADEPHSNTAATTDWKSMYIIAVVAFITAVESVSRNEWNYFCQVFFLLNPLTTANQGSVPFYTVLGSHTDIVSGSEDKSTGISCEFIRPLLC
jgi:hypothetical protein